MGKWILFFMCLFGGFFGLHYFAVGRPGKGILYFFTAGIFGIGWFVDLIRILSGSFPGIRQEIYKKQLSQNIKAEPVYVPEKIKKTGVSIKGVCLDITDEERFPSDYVVMDFETTGLKEYNSKIIQAAAYKYRNHMKTDEMVTYVDPTVPIPENITELTGIHDEDVQGAPTIDKALPQLIEFIKDEVIIGHNVPFDLRFMVFNAEQCGIQLPHIRYIDTLKLSRRYIEGAENYKLKTLKEHLGIVASSHSADEDCYVCGEVYRRCAIQAKLMKA